MTNDQNNILTQDIHQVLKCQENEIPTYYGLSQHINTRRFLVDWLAVIKEKLKLQQTTYHLAVHLLDYYMEGESTLEYNSLPLVALSCLDIAAKVEEEYEFIPNCNILNCFIPKSKLTGLSHVFCREEYLNMELSLLKYFKWRVMKPTTAHFLSYYMTFSVCSGDLCNGVPIHNSDNLQTVMERYTAYYQDVSLQFGQFRSYPPSVVAASCLVASRLYLHITPTWSERLETLTGCCIEELLPCIHLLLRVYKLNKETENLVEI